MEKGARSGGSLRWGLLGPGGAAREFARDLISQGLPVRAVASREAARAAAFASEMGIPESHGSYQALLDSPDIDAIYVALPNHLHAEWSIRAARAGKHVLCEKPAALDEAECEAVLREVERAGVFFMEGFMYRCHPVWGMAAALIEDGRVGEVRELRSSFCHDMGFKPADIRQSKETAGGALTDVGCYCLSFSRLIAGAEPVRVGASSRMGPETRVDEWTSAELRFPDGIRATFECALREARPHAAVILGDRGRLEIQAPWHPSGDGAEVTLFPEGGDAESYRAADGLPLFAREALEVSEHLRARQSPAMTWRDSLGQARALEALRKAAGLA
ncbi:MAG TPA: Gfo/Idh/MocA family oxidoreductase [Fibrobacteria bacterium]|nr:Gfo/Idh/MocA family oxidoreductase [Fibrobacteria bacterium]